VDLRSSPAELDVRPHSGVGPLRLGMRREECRAAYHGRFDEFLKVPDAERTTDIFAGAVCVFYDADDLAEYIEVSRDRGVRPLLDGVAVLEARPAEVVAALAQHADYVEEEPDCSYTFPRLDLALWRPFVSDDHEGRTFMTVGVGRPGYFG
jgi:hypothetical protein